ncbi:MAG: nucleotidyltransferase [Okeania sp. SIO3C4]|nr:nucleotidyltransferase [Okeania sp. SIO3C4]
MSKQQVIHTIREVLKRHRYIVRAELFGSLARGEDHPGSDVDLLVVYDESRPKGFRAFSIDADLEQSLGRRVDLVQEKLLHGFIKETIHEDRELIYERREEFRHADASAL